MRICLLLAAVGGARARLAPREREKARLTSARHHRRLSDSSSFEQLVKRTAADAAAYDNFGFSVAIDGNTVVSGAPGCHMSWCPAVSGSVYVLRASDGEELAKLMAADAAAGDFFGESVAIDGDTVVVGARGDNNVTGAAYVFRTSDGGASYGQVAKLTASDGASGDLFGSSVAIDVDTVVIGASQSRSDDGSGSVYVFRTTDGGATYGQVAKLTAADADASDGFGWSVAIDGDTIVVGAYGDDDAGTDSGAAYVFRTSDGDASYGQVAKLTAADGASDDQFGASVAIDGATVVVGAYCDSDGGSQSGSVYVFRTSDGGDTYGQVAKLTADAAAAGDGFGVSVAIDGSTVVVGASQWLSAGSGSAYVFEEDSSWWDYLSSDATRALPATMIFLATGAAAMLAF